MSGDDIYMDLVNADVIRESTSPEEAIMYFEKQIKVVELVLDTTAMPKVSKQYIAGFVEYAKDFMWVMRSFVYDPKVLPETKKSK